MNKTHKSEIGKFKDIPMQELKEPPCEDRFDLHLTDEENEFIKEIPLVVVYSRESQTNIIVKGRRRFLRARASGFMSLPCFVLHEVEQDWESLLVRLDHVLKVTKPFHVLEMARLVYQIREREVRHNGGKAYFSWGGNRRGKKRAKASLIEVFRERFPQKDYYLRAVDLLGQHLGLLAMEGLYYFLEDKGENLSIYEVHKQNPRLRDVGLREKIESQVKAMQASGAKDEEIKEKVALTAYEALFPRQTAQSPGKGANPGSDGAPNGLDGQSAKASPSPNQQIPGVFRGIKAKEYRKIRALGENFVKQAEGLRVFLKKRELTAADAESLLKKGDELQKAFMDFWLPFTARARPSA